MGTHHEDPSDERGDALIRAVFRQLEQHLAAPTPEQEADLDEVREKLWNRLRLAPTAQDDAVAPSIMQGTDDGPSLAQGDVPGDPTPTNASSLPPPRSPSPLPPSRLLDRWRDLFENTLTDPDSRTVSRSAMEPADQADLQRLEADLQRLESAGTVRLARPVRQCPYCTDVIAPDEPTRSCTNGHMHHRECIEENDLHCAVQHCGADAA